MLYQTRVISWTLASPVECFWSGQLGLHDFLGHQRQKVDDDVALLLVVEAVLRWHGDTSRAVNHRWHVTFDLLSDESCNSCMEVYPLLRKKYDWSMCNLVHFSAIFQSIKANKTRYFTCILFSMQKWLPPQAEYKPHTSWNWWICGLFQPLILPIGLLFILK